MDNSNSLVLLKFHAPWCGPCKAFAPVVDSVVPDFENVQLKGVDVDEDPDSAVKYEVRSIPMLILLKNGQKVGSLVGLRSAEDVKEFLVSHS